MKKLFFTIISISLVFMALPIPSKLSPQAQISVITILPGNELYSKFGHSAIRIKDTKNKIDWVFNYGTFDFNTPNFYLKFVKGKLNYMLSIQPFYSFYNEYYYEQRTTYEQILNLTEFQKQKIYNYLLWNSQPQNRYYLYDFLYDNCATRIRDVLLQHLGDSLIITNKELNTTFRKELKRYVHNPWLWFGMDLLLGPIADTKLDTYTSMFLPDYVASALSKAMIITKEGKKTPLVSKERFIFKFEKKKKSATWWYSPALIFSVLLVLILLTSIKEFKQVKRHKWIDFLLFFITGLIGLILLSLWIFTDHQVIYNNLNIAWALPFNIWFAFASVKKKLGKIAILYAKLGRFYYLMLILFYPLLPQALSFAIIPILGIILFRLALIWKIG